MKTQSRTEEESQEDHEKQLKQAAELDEYFGYQRALIVEHLRVLKMRYSKLRWLHEDFDDVLFFAIGRVYDPDRAADIQGARITPIAGCHFIESIDLEKLDRAVSEASAILYGRGG